SNPDDRDAALTYACCVELGTITTLYRWGLFKTEDDESKYRILLVDENVDAIGSQRKYKLKVPLWVNEIDLDLYDTYYKALIKSPKMVQHKARLVNNIEGKEAFQDIQELVKGFDVNRFIEATINYYVKEGQYAKSLPKFLTELGIGYYESYKEVKSNLI
nr:hypothetical protein [Candidatus Dojkabacteria bacterium]